MIGIDQNTVLALMPPAGMVVLAFLLVIVDLARPGRDRLITYVASAGFLLLMALTVLIGPLPNIGLLTGPVEVFGGAYVRDTMTATLDLLFLSIGLLSVLVGPDYLRPRGLPAAEFAAMLCFALTGAMLPPS